VPKLVISTVSSSNHFQWLIPTFIYSCKKAYPTAGVKVFLLGSLKPELRALLERFRKEKLIDDDWQVYENQFTGIKQRESTCNSLRFLIDPSHYKDYSYVMVRDIDFIVLPHKTTHLSYCSGRMKRMKASYFGTRGRPSSRSCNVSRRGWTGWFSRITGGLVIFSQEWFNQTKKARARYLELLTSSKHDKYDKFIAGSYREYDEVMLYRICKLSKLKTPKLRQKDAGGVRLSKSYRDIHLGDFAKSRGFNRIKKVIASDSVKAFLKLEKDPVWKDIKKVCGTNGKVRVMLRRARKHCRSR